VQGRDVEGREVAQLLAAPVRALKGRDLRVPEGAHGGEHAQELGHCSAGDEPTAVPHGALSRHAQPPDLPLAKEDRKLVVRAREALVQHKRRLHCPHALMKEKELHAAPAAHLLIRHIGEDDGARGSVGGRPEAADRLQILNADTFHVLCSAAVHLAVDDGTLERGLRPLVGLHGYHVHV